MPQGKAYEFLPNLDQVFPEYSEQSCGVPVMAKGRFAEMVGLSQGTVQGMIEKGHLPSIKIGRHRLINLVALNKACQA